MLSWAWDKLNKKIAATNAVITTYLAQVTRHVASRDQMSYCKFAKYQAMHILSLIMVTYTQHYVPFLIYVAF